MITCVIRQEIDRSSQFFSRIQLCSLHMNFRMAEIAELAGVVEVQMAEHHEIDVCGTQSQSFELVWQTLGRVHVWRAQWWLIPTPPHSQR